MPACPSMASRSITYEAALQKTCDLTQLNYGETSQEEMRYLITSLN